MNSGGGGWVVTGKRNAEDGSVATWRRFLSLCNSKAGRVSKKGGWRNNRTELVFRAFRALQDTEGSL